MAFHIAVACACLFIGLSKGGLGGPVPVAMLTPLLSLVIPASQAVGLVLIPLLIGDLFALRLYWGQWDGRQMRLLLPMAVVGVVMGSALLVSLANARQDIALRRILGGFTLLVAAYKLASARLRSLAYQPRAWHGRLAGWAAGFGSALANVGAPPFTAYMLLQPDVRPMAFIGTSTLFFALVNALKLPGIFLSRQVLDIHQLLSMAWAAPLIPVGVWLGRWAVQRLSPVLFDRIMLALLTLLGLFMLFYTPA